MRMCIVVIHCPLSVEVGIGYQVSVPNQEASVPIPDTRYPSPRRSNRLHQNRDHVVQPAPLVGRIDEDAAGLLEVFRVLLHDAENLTFRNHASESVGAEEVNVAGLTGDFVRVGGDLQGAAEGADDDVAEGMFLGFLGSEHSGLYLLEDPQVVVRQAGESALANEVGAG